MPTIEYKIEDEVVLGSFRLTIYFKKDRNESRLGFVLTAEIHSEKPKPGTIFRRMAVPLSDEDQQHILEVLLEWMGEEEAETLLRKFIQRVTEVSREGMYIPPHPFQRSKHDNPKCRYHIQYTP